MRALIAVAAALAVAAAAGAQPMQPSAAITASSYRHAAKPVALTYTLRYEMQCGSPGTGVLKLTFPAQVAVRPVSAADVLLDGKPAPAVKRLGSALQVSLPPQPQIMCDVIGMGTLTVTITKAAGFANPKTPGVYAFPVTDEKISATPKLRIT
jgi:1,6-anhydro-N-acetylmuramate kinase